MTEQEENDIQQPLGKDGYVNPRFNKLYGADKNPYTGTERDKKNGKYRTKTTIFLGD